MFRTKILKSVLLTTGVMIPGIAWRRLALRSFLCFCYVLFLHLIYASKENQADQFKHVVAVGSCFQKTIAPASSSSAGLGAKMRS